MHAFPKKIYGNFSLLHFLIHECILLSKNIFTFAKKFDNTYKKAYHKLQFISLSAKLG